MATFRIENYDASTTEDLISGNTKLLINSSWSWAIRPDDTETTDVFRFFVTGASDTAIMTNFRSVYEKLRDGKDFLEDPANHETYWLRIATDNETAKRTLIKTYDIDYQADEFQSPLIEQNEAGTGVVIMVAITRLSAYEDVSDTTLSPSLSGTYVKEDSLVSTLDGGDEAARLIVTEIAATSLQPITRVWAGIKPLRPGQSFTNISYEWNAGDGGAVEQDADTSYVGGGPYFETDFGSEEKLIPRLAINLSEFYSSSWIHLKGTYRVLLRFRSPTNLTKHEIQIGISGSIDLLSANPIALDTKAPVSVEATGTSVDTVELGEVTIPPRKIGSWGYDNFNYSQSRFVISASRYEGTGVLRFHDLLLIPAEHFMYVETDSIDLSDQLTSDTPTIVIEGLEDGGHNAYITSNLAGDYIIRGYLSPTLQNWGYPKEGGELAVHVARFGISNATDAIDFSAKARRRWRAFHE